MSDHIVKHEQLHDIANDLWTKAKARDIESISYEASTKKIKATKSQATPLVLEAELSNLASVDERTKFKKDVSTDIGSTENYLHIGTGRDNASDNRTCGYRNMTSKLFVDNFVSELIVLVDDASQVGTRVNMTVWAINKKATRSADRLNKVIQNTSNIEISTFMEGSTERKCLKVPINDSFDNNEVYFLVKLPLRQKFNVISTVNPIYRDDAFNTSGSPSADSEIPWENVAGANVGIMYLIGRESIKSLSDKISQANAGSSLYVKQSEVSTSGGVDGADKVVRLGRDGKLNTNMLPELAINRVLPADSKSAALNMRGPNEGQLQLGDVVVITGEHNKVYMCKDATDATFENAFIELSIGDGTVKTVNGQSPDGTGNVVIDLEHLQKVKEELNKKISEITLKNDNKKLVITKATGATSELDLTNAFAAANISYNGQIGTTTKNNVQEAIDALNREVNRGVKSIKGGTPGTNGDLEFSSTQSGTGIFMRFGTNGTPVEIATYMTDREVADIKALFT